MLTNHVAFVINIAIILDHITLYFRDNITERLTEAIDTKVKTAVDKFKKFLQEVWIQVC